MSKPRWLPAIPVLIAVTFGCGGNSGEDTDADIDVPPVEVQVAAVSNVDRPEFVEAVGTIRARRTVAVSSRLLSHIRAIHVDEGQRVQAGQRLIELDNRELVSAREAMAAAKAEAANAIEAATHAQESAEAQADLAAATHKRFQDLLRKESVSQQEYDEVAARLRSARAAVESAKARHEQAVAQQSQAGAHLESADVMLGHATIDSQVAGVVVERLADPGSLAAPGQPILRIEEAGAYRLEAAVPTALLGKVKVGQVLEVAIDALETGEPVEGRVSEIVPEIDPGSRTFIAKISLPPAAGVRSGLYGRALIPVGMRTVLAVPAAAVVQKGQLRSVLVVEADVARRRLVTLGDLRDSAYEGISGLESGELVVLHPDAVADGSPVRVRPGGAKGDSQ